MNRKDTGYQINVNHDSQMQLIHQEELENQILQSIDQEEEIHSGIAGLIWKCRWDQWKTGQIDLFTIFAGCIRI